MFFNLLKTSKHENEREIGAVLSFREVEPLKRDEIEKKGKWTEAVADALTTGEGSSRQRSNSEVSFIMAWVLLSSEIFKHTLKGRILGK